LNLWQQPTDAWTGQRLGMTAAVFCGRSLIQLAGGLSLDDWRVRSVQTDVVMFASGVSHFVVMGMSKVLPRELEISTSVRGKEMGIGA
jgi:hypothetical protein